MFKTEQKYSPIGKFTCFFLSSDNQNQTTF